MAINALTSIGSGVSVPAIASITSPLLLKIVEFAKTYFNLAQWSILWVYGFKEILLDRVRPISQIKKGPFLANHTHRINSHLNSIFIKKDPVIKGVNFNVAHGSLYVTSGVAGSLAGLHHLGLMNLGSLVVPLEFLGNCFFGFASLVALIQNIKIYQAATKIPPTASLHEKESAAMLKRSAIIGIISSLSYIATAAILIIGGPATIALIFGILALFTGCIKILYYDFFRFKDAR